MRNKRTFVRQSFQSVICQEIVINDIIDINLIDHVVVLALIKTLDLNVERLYHNHS